MPDPAIFLDGLTSFELGMNSGILPHLLAANQTAFSTNCTHRSGYVSHRPPVRRMILDFKGNLVTENRVRYGLFQGQCYFASEFGEQGIVASISGRIFFFVYQTSQFEVREVTPSAGADPNLERATVAWLWQSEKWVIINDGQSLPIFFDGQTSRRSRSITISTIATVIANYNDPATIPETVQVQVASVYTGAYNIPVTVDGQTYSIVSSTTSNPASQFQLTLQQTSGSAGVVYPNNTQLKSPSTFTARVLSYVYDGTVYAYPIFNGVIIYPILTLHLSRPYTGAINEQYLLETTTGNASVRVRSISNAGMTIGVISPIPPASPASPIPIIGGAFGIPATWSIGGVAYTFTSPGTGGTVVAGLTANFTGVVGQYLYSPLGTEEYLVTGYVVDPTQTYYITLYLAAGTANAPHVAPLDVTTTIYELPPGRMGAYGMGRNWMCLPDGRSFIASDIVGSTESGSLQYQFRDAVLNVRENSFLYGGGVFVIPGQLGDITSMTFTANLDTSLGQGPLQVGTASTVFSCQAPVDRTTWQNLTNPILTESLKGRGPLGQYGTLNVNSDTLFRSQDGLSSLVLARREFQSSSWGNVPISREMQRVIDQDTKALLGSSTATQFDNRFLVGCFPVQGPFGVYHRGIISLNLDPVSTLRGKVDSIYDGLWTGLNVFQFCSGSFLGTYRTFAFCFDSADTRIELFEILPTAIENLYDNDSIAITWSFETAPLFRSVKGKGQFDQVRLIDGEMYLSDIRGPVFVQVWYRPEFSECWTPWHNFNICADNPLSTDPKQYRTAIGLGKPDITVCDPTNNRPYAVGNNFQLRFQITGSCRFMGVLCKAVAEPAPQFLPPICVPLCDAVTVVSCEPCPSLPSCTKFGLVFYSINAGRTYTNGLLCFDVTQSDGSIINICVPPGTISYTNPYGNCDPNDPNDTCSGPGGPGDPNNPFVLTLKCPNGGVVTRTVPPGATPAQIQAIIQEMIAACADSWANDPNNRDKGVPGPGGLSGGGPSPATNTVVYFVHACAPGETLSYSGTLPSWITIDTANSRLVGAAGTFVSNTVASATAIAQATLNGWANQHLLDLTLTCATPCPPELVCTSRAIPGKGNGLIAYHPGTETLWVCDSFSYNIYVINSTAPYAIATTLDLSAYFGGWDIIHDSKNDQMVILGNDGSLVFVNPSTYAMSALAGIVHSGGIAGRPMAYDPTRGYMLVVDVHQAYALTSCYLINCNTKSVIVNNSQAFATFGSPVYCATKDKYYISYQGISTVYEVNPTTCVFSASTINLGGTLWIFYARSVDATGQLWCQIWDNVSVYGVQVIDVNTMTVAGTVTGADVPGSWSVEDMSYNSCDNYMFLADFSQVVSVSVSDFTEISTNIYDTTVSGMVFVEGENANWLSEQDIVKTECPPT